MISWGPECIRREKICPQGRAATEVERAAGKNLSSGENRDRAIEVERANYSRRTTIGTRRARDPGPCGDTTT